MITSLKKVIISFKEVDYVILSRAPEFIFLRTRKGPEVITVFHAQLI